jgi:hypothetical protein
MAGDVGVAALTKEVASFARQFPLPNAAFAVLAVYDRMEQAELQSPRL